MHANKFSTSHDINIHDGLGLLLSGCFQEGFIILVHYLQEGIKVTYPNYILLNITAVSYLLVYGDISYIFLPESNGKKLARGKQVHLLTTTMMTKEELIIY